MQLSENEDGSALVLNVLDRTEEDGELSLDLSVFNVADGEYGGSMLYADSLLSMNTLNDRQIKEKDTAVTVKDGVITLEVRKLSFTEYIINRG